MDYAKGMDTNATDIQELSRLTRRLGSFRDRPFEIDFVKADGSDRTMVAMNAKYAARFVKGAQAPSRRSREDRRKGLRTIFDLGNYCKLRAGGKAEFEAGNGSWRRVDLRRLKDIRPAGGAGQ